MQRNNTYQRLDGRDDERVPIARPAPQPGYTEEKNLPVVPVSAAPTVPYAETQQF
ncbi:hypothetical protein OESDEN_06504 [Oesophagostomum dentatum]|uniref:Uncharacterized protein n=1 Tax=Oesophagostomum dentatum TaxID=61180 RepID=A0A0B1TCN3_OESDE|nr:hypothetical protein OESDEN_06504 [Oesophagostomum dentatum]